MRKSNSFILPLLLTITSTLSFADETAGQWALAIHGGAGSTPAVFSRDENIDRRAAMERALAAGKEKLASGGTALECVETVVRLLEDHPLYNAGKGAVCNSVGSHELDASIMDGKKVWGGAVAGVTTVRNPITLARQVMTDTKHVLLAGNGAEQFADQMKSERVSNEYFSTERQRGKWQKWQQKQNDTSRRSAETLIDFGTVGCVALDKDGNLAAGTSTGGLTAKKFGRVGDTPILGAGTYANNETCAVSCTGVGEHFIRLAAAFDVAAQMKYQNTNLGDAVRNVLQEKMDAGWGGMIALDHDGNIAMEFTTDDMARAAADSNGRHEVIWFNETLDSAKQQ